MSGAALNFPISFVLLPSPPTFGPGIGWIKSRGVVYLVVLLLAVLKLLSVLPQSILCGAMVVGMNGRRRSGPKEKVTILCHLILFDNGFTVKIGMKRLACQQIPVIFQQTGY